MKKLLLVIDMQNDFITGALGSERASGIVPGVAAKINEYAESGDAIIFTRDTHPADYLSTQEGRLLPVEHCIKDTWGHQIASGLWPEKYDKCCNNDKCVVFDKPSFGSLELAELVAAGGYDEIELCGLCTDICVVSNALILKARLPETKITVDARLCAGVTEESHAAALSTMKMCQVIVNNS